MTKKIKITEPGVYDIPNDVYHADPCPEGSLSNSGAKLLMPVPFKGCPKKFDYDRRTEPEHKNHYDFGHVAHKLVLGEGDEIDVVNAPAWNRKMDAGTNSNTHKEAAYDAGHIPILQKDFNKAEDMARAVKDHAFAGKLFESGKPEQSLFWRCKDTGIMCRARLDWMPTGNLFADYKTCRQTVTEDDLTRTTANLGYWLQAAWYLDGIRTLGLCDDPQFLFVFQETAPPHIVTVAQLSPDYLEWGRMAALKARSIFAECQRTGDWSADYNPDVVTIGPPKYFENNLEQAHEFGAFALSGALQRPHDTQQQAAE